MLKVNVSNSWPSRKLEADAKLVICIRLWCANKFFRGHATAKI